MDLYPTAIFKSFADRRRRQSQNLARGRLQLLQLIVSHIVLRTLGKTVKENTSIPMPIRDNGSKPARPALTPARDALLYQPTSQNRIDETALCPGNGFTQFSVSDPFPARKAGEVSGLENTHTASPGQ